jgi:hypothetical protein
LSIRRPMPSCSKRRTSARPYPGRSNFHVSPADPPAGGERRCGGSRSPELRVLISGVKRVLPALACHRCRTRVAPIGTHRVMRTPLAARDGPWLEDLRALTFHCTAGRCPSGSRISSAMPRGLQCKN